MPVKPPRPGEQTLWDEALADWWWLDRYQLTPAQVDEIPLGSFNRIPEISAIADQLRKEAQERANRG